MGREKRRRPKWKKYLRRKSMWKGGLLYF